MRSELRKIVLEKRELLISPETSSRAKERGDLMTILLSDDIFKDDIEMTLDECLTFFAAGTQTTVSLMTTVLSNVIKNPEIN